MLFLICKNKIYVIELFTNICELSQFIRMKWQYVVPNKFECIRLRRKRMKVCMLFIQMFIITYYTYYTKP